MLKLRFLPLTATNTLLLSSCIAAGVFSGQLLCIFPSERDYAGAAPTSTGDKAALYEIGKRVTKALIMQERNAPQQQVTDEFDDAQKLALDFELVLPVLPARQSDPQKQVDAAVRYAVKDMAPFYQLLENKYSKADSQITALACKGGLLRMFYAPGEEFSLLIGQILDKNGATAFPPSVWQPVANAVRAKKAKSVVDAALNNMDSQGCNPVTYKGIAGQTPSARKKFFVDAASKQAKKKVTTRADKLELWNMGVYIGTAALMNQSSNIPMSGVNQVYNFAADSAEKFQLPLKLPPKRTGDPKTDTMNSLKWALQGSYPLWLKLETDYAETEKVIVEIATKTTLLRLIYDDNGKKSSLADEISTQIKENADVAFPERIWKPLTDAIDRGASKAEIKTQVERLDALVKDWYDPKKPAPHH